MPDESNATQPLTPQELAEVPESHQLALRIA
jgi:hypothetical protein